jgi:hypothetical protein
MSYKILKITTCYNNFLQQVYRKNKGLDNLTYKEQYNHLMKQFYGWADSYEYYLGRIGYKTFQIIANAETLQKTWSKEHNTKKEGIELIIEQIKTFNPEILFIQDPNLLNPDIIVYLKKELKNLKLVIAYKSSPISEKEIKLFHKCDIVLTCSEVFRKYFISLNLKSEILPHAFDKRILNYINPIKNKDVVFSGSLITGEGYHNERIDFINSLLNHPTIPLKIYSEKYNNAKFGLDYFNTLSSSLISINSHIDVAKDLAVNMRLYEATGVGTCLVTDLKSNLAKLFDIDNEIVCYENTNDAIEKIKWLIDNPNKCKDISQKGQLRTLKEYNFENVTTKLDLMIKKYIK